MRLKSGDYGRLCISLFSSSYRFPTPNCGRDKSILAGSFSYSYFGQLTVLNLKTHQEVALHIKTISLLKKLICPRGASRVEYFIKPNHIHVILYFPSENFQPQLDIWQSLMSYRNTVVLNCKHGVPHRDIGIDRDPAGIIRRKVFNKR